MMDRTGDSRSDEELITQVRAGDEQALGLLCGRYLTVCRRLAAQYAGGAMETEDLAQEGMLGLLEAVRRFDPARGVPFGGYARRCVTSKILSALEAMQAQKRRANVGSVPLDAQPHLSVPAPEEQLIESEELLRRSEEITRRLTHSEHEVLKAYLRGGSYEQIAARLGMEPKAVDNALQRVRRKLRQMM